mmetsp:Transcript_29175/g.86377  ORF Transcript_29175/g.86377 Transcript_29175/m.86377 type:complete len:793 (+) Transcript_29175:461-2839(+)
MIAHCHENDPDTAIFGEGNGFIIKNKKKLEEEYLKKYKVCQAKEKDGTPQFESFHRQCNKYGFKKSNKSKEILYRHRHNLFRQGSLHTLRDIKITCTSKKEEVLVDENKTIADYNEMRSQLVAVQKDVQQMKQKMDDQHKEVVGLLHFLTGMAHAPQGTSYFQLNACKRPRSEDTSSDDWSQSTSQACSMTDTATCSSSVTPSMGRDVSHQRVKYISQGDAAENTNDAISKPGICQLRKNSNPIVQENDAAKRSDASQISSLARKDGDTPQDLDCIDPWASDDELFDQFTLQRLIHDDESGSLLSNDTLGYDKTLVGVAPKSFPASLMSKKRRKKHRRSCGNSSSSFASSTSTLSTEGTIGYARSDRLRSSAYFITARNNDVLYGNGDFSHQSGNKRHAVLVSEKKSSYLCAIVDDKNDICLAIVQDIQHHGGLFLEQASGCVSGYSGKECWHELSLERAIQLTACALEEKMQDHPGAVGGSDDDSDEGQNGGGSDPGSDKRNKDAKRKGDDSTQEGSDMSGGKSTSIDRGHEGKGGTGPATALAVCTSSTTDSESQVRSKGENERSQDVTSTSRSTTIYIEPSIEAPIEPILSEPEIFRPISAISQGEHRFAEVLDEIHLEEGCRCVSFSHVSMRKYPMILGDHPVCSSGPPVTMAWRYQAEAPIGVDEYESRRPQRRKVWELILSSGHRKKVLTKEAGHTEWEIREAVRTVKEIKRQRQKSVRNLPFVRIQEAIQATERRFRRLGINKNRNEQPSSPTPKENRFTESTGNALDIRHRDSVTMIQSRAGFG